MPRPAHARSHRPCKFDRSVARRKAARTSARVTRRPQFATAKLTKLHCDWVAEYAASAWCCRVLRGRHFWRDLLPVGSGQFLDPAEVVEVGEGGAGHQEIAVL